LHTNQSLSLFLLPSAVHYQPLSVNLFLSLTKSDGAKCGTNLARSNKNT